MTQKGFTLIELLVVTSIILIISSIILSDYHVGQRQFALQRAVHQLAQDLRQAEEMSMSAKSYNCPTGYKMKGYGINLPVGNDYYWLKARCESIGVLGTYSDHVVGESIKLEKGVKILGAVPANIFFYPPDPEIDLGAAATAQITLCSEIDITQTKTVSINKTGLINVE